MAFKFQPSEIVMWHIFKIAIPSAKDYNQTPHYHVIAYVDASRDDYRGFVITSNPAKKARDAPSCLISIKASELGVLRHDSFLFLDRGQRFSSDDLLNEGIFYGSLTPNVIKRVQNNVFDCKIIPSKIRDAILAFKG